MELLDCPYCGKECVWEQGFRWNNVDACRCGCQTVGCRGNILQCQEYQDLAHMHMRWNTRRGKTPETIYNKS